MFTAHSLHTHTHTKKNKRLTNNFKNKQKIGEKGEREKLTICSNRHGQFQHIWLGDAQAGN